MRCICGHSAIFHDGEPNLELDQGPCEECDCQKFSLDPNWEPSHPTGWEGRAYYNN